MPDIHQHRSRKYSVVIHNTDRFPEGNARIKDYALSLGAKRYLISTEPYNHQSGTHTHLFVEFNFQRSKYNILKSLQDMFPQDGDHGRIQVDIMRGSFEAATEYLQVPGKKNKNLGIIQAEENLCPPKIFTHNHIGYYTYKGVNIGPTPKQKANCQACNYLKWFNGLRRTEQHKQWELECRKPYIRLTDNSGEYLPDYMTPRVIRAAMDEEFPEREKILREFKIAHNLK